MAVSTLYDYDTDTLLPATLIIETTGTSLQPMVSRATDGPFNEIVMDSQDMRGTVLALLESEAIRKLNNGRDITDSITGITYTGGQPQRMVVNMERSGRQLELIINGRVVSGNQIRLYLIHEGDFNEPMPYHAVAAILSRDPDVDRPYRPTPMINRRWLSPKVLFESGRAHATEMAKRRLNETHWFDELQWVDGIKQQTHARLLDGDWVFSMLVDSSTPEGFRYLFG